MYDWDKYILVKVIGIKIYGDLDNQVPVGEIKNIRNRAQD